MQNVTAQLQIRSLYVDRDAPFQAGEQAFFNPLELRRRTVAGDDDFALERLEVVEDVEKHVVRFLRLDLLKIVDDQHVDRLVEVHEIVDLVHAHRIGVLCAEGSGGDKQHALVGVVLFDLQTDGRHQVRFSHSRRTVEKEGVERLSVQSSGDGEGNVQRVRIAFALTKAVEGVFFVEERLHRLGFRRHRLGSVGGIGCRACGGAGERSLSGVRVRVFIDFQFPLHAGAFSKRLVDGLLEGFAQCLHHFFCKDSTGNADIQHSFCVSVELQRPRPSVEQFGRSLLLQRLHTSVPQILHSVLSVREL